MLNLKNKGCSVVKGINEDGFLSILCGNPASECKEGTNGDLALKCFNGYDDEILKAIKRNNLVLNRAVGVIVDVMKEYGFSNGRQELEGQTKLIPSANQMVIEKVIDILKDSMSKLGEPEKVGYDVIRCIELLENLEVELEVE